MLHVQSLERRQLLTSMIETTPFVPENGQLVIEGTKRADQIWLTVDDGKLYVLGPTVSYIKQGAGKQATLLPSAGYEIDLATVKGIRINCGDGRDEVILGNLRIPTTIYGGRGNDTISGGRGNDVIVGQTGSDRIWGGGGNDLLDGGIGNDRLEGSTGNDTLQGGQGDDRLYGGGGTNYINGGIGSDAQGTLDPSPLEPAEQGNDLIDETVERATSIWKEVQLTNAFDGVGIRRTADGRIEAEVGFTFGTGTTLIEFIPERVEGPASKFIIRTRAWVSTGGQTSDMYYPRRRLDLGKLPDGRCTIIAMAGREEIDRVSVDIDDDLKTVTKLNPKSSGGLFGGTTSIPGGTEVQRGLVLGGLDESGVYSSNGSLVS